MHPWRFKHQKRVPIEQLQNQNTLSTAANDPPACHCGKSAHRIVHDKSGKCFIGFCADHFPEAEDAARKRYKISEQKKVAAIRNRRMYMRAGDLSDLSDHNHKDNHSRHVKNTRRR